MLRKGYVVPGIIGAIVVHPIIFAIVFSIGAVNGASSAQWFSATGPDPSAPKLVGIEGGMKLVEVVVVAYVLTVGIVPLLASTVGFVVGMLIAIIWRRIQSPGARDQGRWKSK